MACKECDYKGYIETAHLAMGGEFSGLQVCNNCKDYTSYSKKVQEVYASHSQDKIIKNTKEYYNVISQPIPQSIVSMPENVAVVDFVNKRRVV